MAHTFTSEDESQVREWARVSVRGGFTPRDTIVDDTIKSAEDEFSIEADEARPFVERIVGEEWEALAREQTTWDAPTDCDRLERAFALLEKRGIVARQDFSCCGNCGSSEIWDEAEGGDFDGYVFYHRQNTDRAVRGGGLYFEYGSFQKVENVEEYTPLAVAVGHRIVAALRDAGFQPDWDGSTKHSIFLPMNWKKRLPVDA